MSQPSTTQNHFRSTGDVQNREAVWEKLDAEKKGATGRFLILFFWVQLGQEIHGMKLHVFFQYDKWINNYKNG